MKKQIFTLSCFIGSLFIACSAYTSSPEFPTRIPSLSRVLIDTDDSASKDLICNHENYKDFYRNEENTNKLYQETKKGCVFQKIRSSIHKSQYNFQKAYLKGAHFYYLEVGTLDFTLAQVFDSTIEEVRASELNFHGAKAQNIKFINSNILRLNAYSEIISDKSVEKDEDKRAIFDGAEFTHTSFQQYFFAPNSSFINARFTGGFLGISVFKGSDFSKATFRSVNANATFMNEANLSDTTWIASFLQLSSLRDVDLTNARILYTEIDGADIRGVDFSKANEITESTFFCALYDDSTKFPKKFESWPEKFHMIKISKDIKIVEYFDPFLNLDDIEPLPEEELTAIAEVQDKRNNCLKSLDINPPFFPLKRF